jgi:hypothetical protein
MANTSPEIEARIAELKSAPVRVRRAAGFGTMVGFALLLRFVASAFAGHVSFGRAIVSGIAQFLLFWFCSFSVQDRKRWAWWALLGFCVLQAWGAVGHLMRLARVTLEGGLLAHGREAVFDVVGTVQFFLIVIVVCLLLSRDVREYVQVRTV